MVKERGIVKGFREDRLGNGTRIWRGISTIPPSGGDRVEAQKSCKREGVVDSIDTIDQNLETYSREPLAEEGLEKTANRVDRVGDEVIPPSVRGYEVHYYKGES
jgi:hypothetical protein